MIKHLGFLLFACSIASAYIPHSEYVLEQVTKNAGKGAFYVENEVTFRSTQETITVKELWWIQDSATMRLSVKGPGINVQYVYRDARSEFMNEAGKTLARRTPGEMLEKFFFARQPKTLSDFLNAAHVIGHNAAKPAAKPIKTKDFKHEDDPHMQLDRIGNRIAIVISQNVQPQQLGTTPGLWIDQSDFSIKRIRFSSGTEMNTLQSTPLSQGLVLPKERVVTWPAGSAEIRLLRANSVAKLQDSDIPPLTSQSYGNSALSVVLKEFYTRFR